MNRRTFLKTTGSTAVVSSIGVNAAFSLAGQPANRRSADKPVNSLSILVLGGTRFVGPAVVRAALARNHTVTLFNRGLTNPQLFPGLESLKGNRYPELGEGLRALNNRSFDVVIDTAPYFPRLVRASAEMLASRCKQYILVSSISVYANYREIGLTENSPVRQLAVEQVDEKEDPENGRTYGARKVLCERVAEEIMPGRVTTVRPCSIIGGGVSDDSARYWPARLFRGGHVLGPGTGQEILQVIDVKDVADFIVLSAEKGLVGAYNTVGPVQELNFAAYLEACRQVTGSSSKIIWADFNFMKEHGIDRSFPQWSPTDRIPGFARISAKKALDQGMTLRPLVDSVRDDWQWFRENFPADYDFAANGTGISPQREAELIAVRMNG